ncbi:MAG: 3-isopropylmalate dehydratase small subunit [Rhodospirillaceae bacterium]|jgi:3-isopropylmalate/(R)-2-methylmalate dehydratase small subunit|nr:3-isopropylmalate dehydratase small subunit [Rhodospirillaceae bacterium]MBT3628719.1 3-isopropylmalate dehydratase small subunit [Rhodospirillaceae bacterium]MBT3927284.1 3-isopropylmalate dehydratase small subunit [Rhodospirillaceae bacterium]MBT4427343.1 3-isopropylmalate dehydratase small subunit [Rhodospirillaceae bacterium]MBT5039986.1 3-isopropylmalate dehydratase small subunit [Rhodospirillaceae bacterium]
MKNFTTLSGPAAPLNMINVDTDQIIPKQYLSAISRAGLGKGLFHDFRYDMADKEKPDFILNREPYRDAKILLAGDNFGCGSSREHAPWSLDDFGIRCVIAPGFADIFFNNCVKNGVLLIVMDEAKVGELMALADNPQSCQMSIDLDAQSITLADGSSVPFEIESFRKHRLMNGLDDIEITLQKNAEISAFEAKQKAAMPWLYR